MKKLVETPLKLVIEVQFGTDIETVLEVIFAVACHRAENKREYAEAPDYWQYDYKRIGSSAYLIAADNFSVELMEIIAELKKLLQIEVYFENHGNTEIEHYKNYNDDEYFDISDNALWRLNHEEPHDRHEKISA